jgi:hypothetical protein
MILGLGCKEKNRRRKREDEEEEDKVYQCTINEQSDVTCKIARA